MSQFIDRNIHAKIQNERKNQLKMMNMLELSHEMLYISKGNCTAIQNNILNFKTLALLHSKQLKESEHVIFLKLQTEYFSMTGCGCYAAFLLLQIPHGTIVCVIQK